MTPGFIALVLAASTALSVLPAERTLGGDGFRHADVAGLALSHDGGGLVTVGERDGARGWDVSTGRARWEAEADELGAVSRGGGDVVVMRWSLGGRSLVSVDGATGKERGRRGYEGDATVLAVAEGGERVALGERDGVIRRFAGRSLAPRPSLEGHGGQVRALAFGPGGARLASAGEDKQVLVWDAASGARRGAVELPSPAWSLGWSADGRWLAAGDGAGTVRVWDAETLAERAAWSTTGWLFPIVFGVALSPDGALAATASQDGTVRLWDAATGAAKAPRVTGAAQAPRVTEGPRAPLLTGDDEATAVAFSADGNRVAASLEGGALLVWDVATGKRVGFDPGGHRSRVVSVAASADGRLGATAAYDGLVMVWDLATGKRLHVLGGHGRAASAVAFSPDGRTLATGGRAGDVQAWDAATGARTTRFLAHERGVTALAFTPTGQLLSGGADHAVALWDVATGTRLAELGQHEDVVRDVAVSRDGRRAASVAYGEVLVWDLAARRATLELETHEHGSGSRVAFAPDGKTLAVSASDSVAFWRLPGGVRTHRLETDAWSAGPAAWLAGGKRLVLTDTRGDAWVVEARTGRTVATWKAHAGASGALALVPGTVPRVLTGGADALGRVWRLDEATLATRRAGEEAEGPRRVAAPARGERRGGERPACKGGAGTDALGDALPPCAAQRLGTRRWRMDTSDVGLLAWSPDGRLVAGASDDEEHAHVWDAATGVRVARLRTSEIGVAALAWSADSRLLEATDSWGGRVRVWDVARAQKIAVRRAEREEAPDEEAWDEEGVEPEAKGPAWRRRLDDDVPVAVSPDGLRAAVGAGVAVRLADARTGLAEAAPAGHRGWVQAVAFDGTGQAWTATREDGLLAWDPATGKQTARRSVGDQRVAAWSADASVAAWGAEGAVRVAAGGKAKPRRIALAGGWDGMPVAVSAGGRFVAAAGGEPAGTRAFRVKDGRELARVEYVELVDRVAISPGGRWLARSYISDDVVEVWDTRTGRRVLRRPHHESEDGETVRVRLVAFSPDGRWLVTGGDDDTVRLWKAGTWRAGPVLEGHEMMPVAVAFTGDGRTVLTASWDHTVGVWRVRDGKLRARLRGHEGPVEDVAVSSDGTQAISGSWDATALVWDLTKVGGR